MNRWVEDSVFSCILRKKFDKYSDDKEILYLYRLLAILYRVRFPIKGDRYELDNDIKIVLEGKICNAAMM